MKVAHLCPTLCNPMDCSLPGSSVHGILQARILEWTAIPFYRGCSQPTDQIQVSRIADGFFTISANREALEHWSGLCRVVSCREVTQSCPTLCDPMDCSLPGSSLHGILQARILEWVGISFFRGSSRPRDQTPVSCIAGIRYVVQIIFLKNWIYIIFGYSHRPTSVLVTTMNKVLL